MGACARGWQATRVLDKLPADLDIPLVRVLLEAYEAGNGSLQGAWSCVPKELLERLRTFLEDERTVQSDMWKRYEQAGGKTSGFLDDVVLPDGSLIEAPEDELELIDDFLADIETELFYHKCDVKGNRTEEKEARDRIIDGGKLCL